jgi:hypothetical protein
MEERRWRSGSRNGASLVVMGAERSRVWGWAAKWVWPTRRAEESWAEGEVLAQTRGKSYFLFLFSDFYFKFKSNSSLNSKLLLLDAQIKHQHEWKLFLYICFILVLLYMIPIIK